MSQSTQYYLFAYDISCPKRQARVRRILQAYATGSQKSLFECLLTPEQCNRLCRQLPLLLDSGDKLHCLTLNPHDPTLLYGTAKPLRYHTFIIG